MAKDFTKHSESTAPTDEQLEEAAEFLEMVMEIGAPQNEWEQSAVQRLHDVVVKARETGRPTEPPGPVEEPAEPPPEEPAEPPPEETVAPEPPI